jgi:hypothetical protein
MENLNQQYDTIMKMSYRDLKEVIKMYPKLHPKKEVKSGMNVLKGNVDISRWHR